MLTYEKSTNVKGIIKQIAESVVLKLFWLKTVENIATDIILLFYAEVMATN
jgi:hypothetical protein